MTTRVAVLGAGGIARGKHLPAAVALENDVELVAVVEPERERREAAGVRFNVDASKLYRDADAMLAEVSPDLVMIATPPHTHEQLAIASMRAGAWAYCEKPLTGSLASADRIIAAERETGRWCVTVSQFRYAAGSQATHRQLRDGTWGRPLVGTTLTEWFRAPEYWDIPWRGKVATEFAGAATTQGYHAIDLLLWLMGEWESVSGHSGTLGRSIEVEDSSVAAVRFASGALASLVATIVSHRQSTRLSVHAERASVLLETLYMPLYDEWTITQADASGEHTKHDWAPRQEDISAHQAQLAHIVRAHQTGVVPDLTATESRGMLEFLTALYKSSATGAPVTRGEVVPGDPFYNALAGESLQGA